MIRSSAGGVMQSQGTLAATGYGSGLDPTDTTRSRAPTYLSKDSETAGLGPTWIWLGDGSSSLDFDRIGNIDDGIFAATNVIFAWEGLLWDDTDRDYNDMVVFISGFRPVAEPATAALLLPGVAGLGVPRRRRGRRSIRPAHRPCG